MWCRLAYILVTTPISVSIYIQCPDFEVVLPIAVSGLYVNVFICLPIFQYNSLEKKNKLQETLKIQLHYCTFLSIPKAPFSSKLFKNFFNLFFNVLFVQENWNSKISERKKDSNIFCKKMEIGIGWEKWLSWFLRWSLKSLSKSNLASGTMRNR